MTLVVAVAAVVNVNGHTADDLVAAALNAAAPLFRAHKDRGTWYAPGSYSYQLGVLNPIEAHQASDHREGWVATLRVGLVKTGSG